eukprot:8891912-Pyramimonas_sp.AAC.2
MCDVGDIRRLRSTTWVANPPRRPAQLRRDDSVRAARRRQKRGGAAATAGLRQLDAHLPLLEGQVSAPRPPWPAPEPREIAFLSALVPRP